MFYYIYMITNNINNKRYIGQRIYRGDDINKDNYMGSGRLLKLAQKKYGMSNFSKQVIEYCDDAESLDEAEIWWIKAYDAQNNPMFYNLAYGGQGNSRPTDETKQKMAESWTEDRRQSHSDYMISYWEKTRNRYKNGTYRNNPFLFG